MGRYFASSIKGSREVDWEEAASREAFLDGDHQGWPTGPGVGTRDTLYAEEGSAADQRIARAAELLTQLLGQDVEPSERGYRMRKGPAKDRIPSVHDPEQRHGRKSSGSCFTGYKGAVAVDVESQLVTAVEVLAGNAFDGDSAANLVAASSI